MSELRKSRLLEYLNAINSNEWKPLNEFINYRNSTKKDILLLFRHFYKFRDRLKNEKASLVNVIKELFPDKSRKNVLNTYSSLTDEVKLFLIQQQLSTDKYSQQILLLQALNRKGLYDQSNKLVNQVNKQLDNEKIGLWNNLHRQLIHHHHYFSENIKHEIPKHDILQTSIKSAKLYHEQIRSLYKLEVVNSIRLNKVPYTLIEDEFKITTDSNDKIVNILYSLIKVISEQDEKEAKWVASIMTKDHELISRPMNLIMYILMRSYYAKQANIGNLSYARKMFDLQKFMIDHNYLNYNNQIKANRFIMIVELSAFLGEWQWAEKFVESNVEALFSKDRFTVYSIAQAFILYSQEKFSECLEAISTIYPKNITLKSILNRLELITYLELYKDDKFFLKHRLDNYRLFCIRNKKSISQRVYTGSINLHKIITMMVNEKSKEEIISKIKSMEILFYRLYLFNKLEKKAQKSLSGPLVRND